MNETIKFHSKLYWVFTIISLLIGLDLVSGSLFFGNANTGIVGLCLVFLLKPFLSYETLAITIGAIISFSRVLLLIFIAIALFESGKVKKLKKELYERNNLSII